jgi:hypothetical protein
MADTAAHLVDCVLPFASYRQWVISFPRRIRFLLARDAELLGEALRSFLRVVFTWQRRQARTLGIRTLAVVPLPSCSASVVPPQTSTCTSIRSCPTACSPPTAVRRHSLLFNRNAASLSVN